MAPSVNKIARTILRAAVVSHFGPLGAALCVAGSAVSVEALAAPTESEWAKAGAGLLTHLGSEKTSALFDSAAEGFRSRHNEIATSLKAAALEALPALKAEAQTLFPLENPDDNKGKPGSYDDWFDDWIRHLQFTPAAQLFASPRDLNPVALNGNDDRVRDLWWNGMEPVLAAWRKTENSEFTQLHLSGSLPLPLGEFLRDRPPEALHEALREVLRDKKLEPSWIAYQQEVFDTLRGHGHVLITSRNQHWDGVADTVSVTQWSIDESARFLLERTGQQVVRDRQVAAFPSGPGEPKSWAASEAPGALGRILSQGPFISGFAGSMQRRSISTNLRWTRLWCSSARTIQMWRFTARTWLAAILYDLQDNEGAQREIDSALEIFRKKLPPGHPRILNAEGWRKTILGAQPPSDSAEE